MKPSTGQAPYFAVLDSLRGICAMMVVLFHFHANSHIENLPLVRNSWLFVDFFFVLSGFVIAANYTTRLQNKDVSIWRFMGLRLARLYPLHLFMLGVFVATEALMLAVRPMLANADRIPFEGTRSLSLLPENAFLLQSLGRPFGLSGVESWNVPSWSISAEVWAYLVFAIALIAGYQAIRLYRAFAFLVIPAAIIALNSGSINLVTDGGVFRCIMGFGVGTVLWQLFQRFRPDQRVTGRWEIPVFAGMVLFVSYAPTYGVTLLAPVVFGIVLWVFSAEQGLLSRVFSTKGFLLMGVLSYSIYMVHSYLHARLKNLTTLLEQQSGLELFSPSEGNLFGTTLLAGDLFVVTGCAITLVVSYATWKFVEMPGQRLVRGWVNAS